MKKLKFGYALNKTRWGEGDRHIWVTVQDKLHKKQVQEYLATLDCVISAEIIVKPSISITLSPLTEKSDVEELEKGIIDIVEKRR